MDAEFKRIWEEFLSKSTHEKTRLDKELAHRFFIRGRDGRWPEDRTSGPEHSEP